MGWLEELLSYIFSSLGVRHRSRYWACSKRMENLPCLSLDKSVIQICPPWKTSRSKGFFFQTALASINSSRIVPSWATGTLENQPYMCSWLWNPSVSCCLALTYIVSFTIWAIYLSRDENLKYSFWNLQWTDNLERMLHLFWGAYYLPALQGCVLSGLDLQGLALMPPSNLLCTYLHPEECTEFLISSTVTVPV